MDLFKDICSEDASVVTKGLVLLQKSFKEVEFLDSFLGQPHSLKQLIKIICSSEGNLLGYALVALQNLMEHDHGWEALEANFIGSVSIYFFLLPMKFYIVSEYHCKSKYGKYMQTGNCDYH